MNIEFDRFVDMNEQQPSVRPFRTGLVVTLVGKQLERLGCREVEYSNGRFGRR